MRQGIPCEDASGSYADAQGRYYVAVVADGHGDPTCARSDRGSRIAVSVTINVLRAFAEGWLANGAHTAGDDRVQTDVVLSRWSQAVIADYESDPMSDEGWASLGLQGFSTLALADRRRSHAIEHLYGSTLVALLVLPDRIVALQQGDGLAVFLTADGGLIKPVPDDPLCHQNVTTSLSDLNARAEFKARQVVVSRGAAGGVVACFAASDGIDKSLPNVAAVKNYFRNITLEALELESQEVLEGHLGRWFENLSAVGIGDDVSCAGFVDLALGSSVRDVIVQRRDESQRSIDLLVAKQKLRAMANKADYYRQSADAEEREAFFAEYRHLEGIVSELSETSGLRAAPVAAGERSVEPSGSVPGVPAGEAVESSTEDEVPGAKQAEVMPRAAQAETPSGVGHAETVPEDEGADSLAGSEGPDTLVGSERSDRLGASVTSGPLAESKASNPLTEIEALDSLGGQEASDSLSDLVAEDEAGEVTAEGESDVDSEADVESACDADADSTADTDADDAIETEATAPESAATQVERMMQEEALRLAEESAEGQDEVSNAVSGAPVRDQETVEIPLLDPIASFEALPSRGVDDGAVDAGPVTEDSASSLEEDGAEAPSPDTAGMMRTNYAPSRGEEQESKPISLPFVILLAALVFAIVFAAVLLYLSWRSLSS